jgi:predicted alpha/beta-fold hydrolase
MQDVMSAKRIREFDRMFTIKSLGFESTDEYYYDISSNRGTQTVNCPFLVV